MGSLAHLLAGMSGQELLQLAAGFEIEKDVFVDAWHDRFHDSKEFIRATFDVFDTDGDDFLSAAELEGIVDLALRHGGEVFCFQIVITEIHLL